MKPIYWVNINGIRYTVPQDTLDTINNYAEHGLKPGSFVEAVLCNDLTHAVTRADSDNLANLPAIVNYIYWQIPHNCWGSSDMVGAWLTKKSEERNGITKDLQGSNKQG